MIARTQRWLTQLARDNDPIMVPAVAVAEYLAGFPEEEQQAQLEALSRNFFIPAFDARCSALAAILQLAGASTQHEPGVRVAFKADVQIIATAISQSASSIVTGNLAEYRRIAGNRILVSDVPETWEQDDWVPKPPRDEGFP